MEFWDLYDENRRPLGRTHPRGLPLRPGEYHVSVFVWVFNREKKLLLMKRSPQKRHYPNLWAATGGAVQAGETSTQAIRRELLEETGIAAEEGEFRLLETVRVPQKLYFSDIYLLQKDVPREAIVFQEGETCDARWVSRAEFTAMAARGELAFADAERFLQLEPHFARVFA